MRKRKARCLKPAISAVPLYSRTRCVRNDDAVKANASGMYSHEVARIGARRKAAFFSGPIARVA